MKGKDQPPMDIWKRSFDFAVRIVSLCSHLMERPGACRRLANQLLNAGTSIGANIEEAQAGQSRADFISKNSIALKEARETHYWLRLLVASKILPETRISGLLEEAGELLRIIGSIVVSAKRGAAR
jgi:four helix bundle protein